VAIAYDVIDDKKKKKIKPPEVDNAWTRLNKHTILPLLTFADEIPHNAEKEQRFSAAMVHHIVEEEPDPSNWAKARAVLAVVAGPTSKEVKSSMSDQELKNVLKDISLEELTMEDKVDEVRTVLPSLSSMAVKKLLQESGEDVAQAIKLGQSRGFL